MRVPTIRICPVGIIRLRWVFLGSGAFSTNLTGLEKGKVYYFRTAASNGSGSVVSNSLGIFQVANAGGLTVDPTAVYPDNIKLWLDANHSSASSGTWTDRSNSANHATKNGSAITVASNVLNGLPVMRYTMGPMEIIILLTGYPISVPYFGW